MSALLLIAALSALCLLLAAAAYLGDRIDEKRARDGWTPGLTTDKE